MLPLWRPPPSCRLLALAQTQRPAVLCGLAPARDGQRVRRHVAGDDRARSDIGAVADFDRRDQGRIGADEGVPADLGAMLRDTVVIAGDGAGTDIGAGTNGGVADIAEVVGLGAGLDDRLLDLDEIADVHVVLEASARAKSRIGADQSSLADMRLLEM